MNPDIEQAIDKMETAMSANQFVPADGRANTSAENGKKGGRKAIDYAALAEEYQVHFDTITRWSKGQFFAYDKKRGAYRVLTEKEQGAHVAAYLRSNDSTIAYSSNIEKNIVGALRATDNLDLVPPCWTHTGERADGWVAMKNGLLNIEMAARGQDGALREHTDAFFSTYALPYNWNPEEKCPRWEKFLGEVLDAENVDMVQKLFGLLFHYSTAYQCFWEFYGPGGCGKSTCMSVMRGMLGAENSCRVPMSDFTEKFTVGLLTQKKANFVDDSPTADSFRNSMNVVEGFLKEITGGIATMKYEPKGVDADTSRLVTARCVFCQNPPLPPFTDRSDGIWDRLRVVVFTRRFRGTDQQNPNLANEILAEEKEGIFAWAMRGLGSLLPMKQFPQSPSGNEIIIQHRATCDRERAFLTDRFKVENGAFTPSCQVYPVYAEWCQAEGYHKKNAATFAQEVKRVFPTVENVNIRHFGKMTRGFLNLQALVEENE